MNRFFVMAGSLLVAGIGAAALAGGLQAKPGTTDRWQLYGFSQDPRNTLIDRQLLGDKSTKRTLLSGGKGSDRIIVWYKPGARTTQFESRYGLKNRTTLRSDTNIVVYQLDDDAKAETAVENLRKSSAVVGAYVDSRMPRTKYGFVPNDPYFKFNNPIGFPGQWHLVNNTGGTIDVKVAAAWAKNYTGTGRTIGIVDDSVEATHPDLAPNFSAADSWDFGSGDADPSPVNDSDEHGVSVAGVAAARGGNGIGVTGVAPLAKIAGLRLDFNNWSDAAELDAIRYRSTGATPTIQVKNHSYGISDTFYDTSAEIAAINDSAAAGTIHVVAAGNDRGYYTEDSNKAMLQNSPNTIAVSALAEDGRFALYSSYGANVFVTAPSSGDVYGRFPGITTTDRTTNLGYSPSDGFTDPNYTSEFGGTSSASPLVAGIMVLGKQVNSKLNVRMAKHILARTSTVVHAQDKTYWSDGGWKTNAAGFKFNQNYGFGLINADAFTSLAARVYSISPLQTETVGPITGGSIPDGGANSNFLTKTFTLAGTTPLEDLQVALDVTHGYVGDLEAYLVSPSGTRSRLFARAGSDSHENLQWTFTTNAFWGEIPTGTWKLEVHDFWTPDAGTLNSFTVTAHAGTISFDDALPVSVTGPTTIIANRDTTAKVVFKNTGSSTWKINSASDYFFLRTFGPEGNTFWTPNAINLDAADSIAPGASKTFTFTVRAPSTAGTYNFQWTMRHNGQKTFGTPTAAKSVTVLAADDDAAPVSVTVPSTLKVGTTSTATVVIKNTGTTTWNAADTYPIILRSVNPNSNTTWGLYQVKLATGETVAPGASKTFTFTIKAPATAGSYNFQWRAYRSSKYYFGLPTANSVVKVTP